MAEHIEWLPDGTGIMRATVTLVDDVTAEPMHLPVTCRFCGKVYDLGTVTVTARYADCSCWTTPCCGKAVDDRPTWGAGARAYTPVERA